MARAKFKPIGARQTYHACISYHKTDKETVEKHIVNELKALHFKIVKVTCDDSRIHFSERLKKSDAWVEVLTDEYKDCTHCDVYYNTFIETRQKTKTKELQKFIQIPPQNAGDGQGILLCVHSDYSADVDAFSGLESDWLKDLQMAIVTRFHAFLSYHESDQQSADFIMENLAQNDYLVTHKRKFLSEKDAKKKAVEEKMSDKIITLFSAKYVENRRDLNLVEPILKDRGMMGWIPVVIEWDNTVNQYLQYQPRVVLVADKSNKTEKWNTGMNEIQKGIDNPDGLPSDCGTVRKDGPPGILHYKSIESVVHSVGKIKVNFFDSIDHGTGFCAKGTSEKYYIFTAYHVIANIIDSMIHVLVEGKTKQEKETLLKEIGFSEENLEYVDGKDYHYWQTKPGELKFGDYTPDLPEDHRNKLTEMTKMWEDVSIKFPDEKCAQEKSGQEEIFHFEIDIPFMSQRHDIILLMLKATSEGSSFPKPLQLDSHSIGSFWHLTGYGKNHETGDAIIATWCPVFDENSFKDSENWWLRRKTDKDQHEKIYQQFSRIDRLGIVPFKGTEPFKGGCSGSPCWCVSSKDVNVQGVYLGCLPDAYFEGQREEPKDLAFRHRPEIAMPMKKIFDLLNEANLSDLIKDLKLNNQD